MAAGLVLLIAAANGVFADVGTLPTYDGFHLTPDGQRLLMLKAHGETYDLVVRDWATGIEDTIWEASASAGLLNWCHWASNERIVCSLRFYKAAGRAGKIIYTRMMALDHDGSEVLRLIPRAKNYDRRPPVWNPQVQDRVVSWLSEDSEHILLQLNRDNPNRPSVYRLNIYNNRLSRIHKPRSAVRRWYANHEGEVVMAIGYRRETDPVVYRFDGRHLFEFKAAAFRSEIPPAPLAFSNDGQSVYMNMTNGTDRHGVYRVRLADGEVLETLHHDPEFDVFANLVLDPETADPVGVKYVKHHPTTVWFDDQLRQMFSAAQRAMPGKQMDIVSSDVAYERFVLLNYGGVAPRFYLYDRGGGQIDLLGRQYPDLRDDAVVDLEAVSYSSRDGIEIPAYLAVPKQRNDKRVPTILFPHGGPYARDSAEFDYWTQFFVDRGYAVLKPNYRGSVGYGEYFMRAGYRQWGLKMQEDLLDGLDWLIDEGIADADRVCVVGASFGGYSALVSAFKHAERIQCAVSMAGVADLEKLVQRIGQFDLVERNRMRIQSGEALRDNSPFHQVERFAVPVLLVHGELDTVVRARQSRRLAKRLERLNKPFVYVEQPRGDHFLSGESQRVEFFKVMRQFLDNHLGSAH